MQDMVKEKPNLFIARDYDSSGIITRKARISKLKHMIM